jgi:osmotically-inducible protein OsmY
MSAVTDEKIKKEVVDQLYWDSRVDASEIDIEVDDGKVLLKGEVPDYGSKASASSGAWTIEGVTTVENDIQVNYPSTMTVPTDEDIASSIRTSLELDADIDATDIDISVTGGIVTLEGTVDAYWKKQRVEDIASNAEGVVDLVNKISIVPTEDFLDKDIAEEIIGSISRNFNVNEEEIDVIVKDGEVTLSGKVDDWNAYRAVLDAAEFTPGVKDVKDQLIIESL